MTARLVSLSIATLVLSVSALNSARVLADHLQSPEVHADGSVTFRLDGSDVSEASVKIERVDNGTLKMSLDEHGVWSATTDVLPAGIYEYRFVVNGVSQLDPRNRWVKKWYQLNSLFEIPGDPPLDSERQEVPHGVLHHHLYSSHVTGTERAAVVYTPPGYEQDSDRAYPILFLLHGFGDDQTAWTEVGRAHLVADNLIAKGKIPEMVIVMPHGHPVALPYGERPDDYGKRNNAAIERDLTEVLLPIVEKRYRVRRQVSDRGIVGLSMGGGHALLTGLKHTNLFGWIGAFSAAAPENTEQTDVLDALQDSENVPQLIWIACGKDDFLLNRNRSFVAALTRAKVKHEYSETPGAHNWDVWRDDYLPAFLQSLFRN